MDAKRGTNISIALCVRGIVRMHDRFELVVAIVAG
ncbi:hypothetical protein AciX8_3310 [Granulicella mallensis MP5ACTX8]|uniref:Uncharacterized protein n=1 Tax=Granulicella mallensis (strain ATCC BAA-1857 / DSM 23137 / MP5ACTX8) TaxID=682795 RepID=G8NUR8_GRAMM|nr:hypothetical protein AciX8_3310 [Granulicella mallensis MP5ACTX8]